MSKKGFKNNYSAGFDFSDNRYNTGNFGTLERSEYFNRISYEYYIKRLTELSISMFEWENLPDTVDERFIELTLFTKGIAVYFNDDVIGNVCLQCVYSGQFDIYGVPTNRRAYSPYTYYNLDLTPDDSVVIYNNMLHENTYPIVRYFANRLWELDRIIDINARAQKTPMLIKATQQQRLTMLNLYKDYDGNVPLIFGDKNINFDDMTVFRTDAPYVAGQIYELKQEIWNDALTYLGISNSGTQKRERLVKEEATNKTGDIFASRYSRLSSRRKAAEKINTMFGTNIEVNYRQDLQNLELGIGDSYGIDEELEEVTENE